MKRRRGTTGREKNREERGDSGEVDRLTAIADDLLRQNGDKKATQVARRKANAARKVLYYRIKETRQRVEAQKRAEAEEWDAEIAQFGEEKAIRRRLEEADMRRGDDDLPISEIEQLEIEEKNADPEIAVFASPRVNKKME